MSILRSGSTEKYANNWSKAFGGEASARKKPTAAKTKAGTSKPAQKKKKKK